MIDMPKILFLTAAPLSVGGVENHLLALGEGLKFNYQISLLGDLKPPFVDQWRQLGLRVYPHSQAGSLDLGAIRHIRDAIKLEAPDVVHIHDSRAGFSARLASIGLGIPVVCSNHYPSYHYVDISPLRRVLYREIERVLNWTVTDYSLYLFENTYNYAVSRHIAPRRRAMVIQTGIEVNRFFDAANPELSRKNQKKAGTRLLVVARLTPQKRVGLAIRTAARLIKEGYQVQLSIVGDGPDREALENEATLLGIGDQVEFLGFRKDIPEVMAESDIFLLTSRFEGGPYALMEAMAAGLPCVSIDIGDAAVMLNDDVGMVISDADPTKFARAIILLIEDNQLLKQIGGRAQSRAAAKFSISKMIAEYDKFYSEISDEKAEEK